jgi:PAS domain S-box-containing protein
MPSKDLRKSSAIFYYNLQKILTGNELSVDICAKYLSLLGENLDVQRVYVFKNSVTSEGRLVCSQLAEWNNGSFKSQINNKDLQNIAYDNFLWLLPSLKSKAHISGIVEADPDPLFKNIMASQNIKSYLFIPIKNDSILWGFLGFDDCFLEREWSENFVLVGKTAGDLLSKFIRESSLLNTLAKRDQQLSVALENEKSGIWEMDFQKNTIHFSVKWCELFNYTSLNHEQNIAFFEKIIHPEDRKRVLKSLDPYGDNLKLSINIEYRILTGNNEYKWVLSLATFKKNEYDLPVKITANSTDISSSINYQININKKEAEYLSLVNTVHDVVFKVNHEGTISFVNTSWERITGFEVSKTLHTQPLQYVYMEDRNSLREKVSEMIKIQNSGSAFFETRLLTAQGSYNWVEAFLTVQFDEKNNIEISGTLVDIHKRKTAEIALKESEERFRLMSDTMSDIVALHSVSGSVFYVSKSVKTLLGYDPELIISQDSYALVHPEDKDKMENEIYAPILRGEIDKGMIQNRLKHKDGSYLWFETIVQPIFNETDVEVLLSTSREITERKKAELNMQHTLEKEKELSELKSRFISMASHEFRTPLTSINSSIDVLEHYTNEIRSKHKSSLFKHFDRIRDQIVRLTNLMNDILILGKREANKMPFEPKKLNVIDLCLKHIEENHLNRTDNRSVEFKIEGQERTVFADEDLINHILSNALSNAFKYSEGKPNPELTIFFKANYYEIIVRDYGIGIPENEKNQLFESFFRANNASSIQGTGLGLVIMKQFVEMHGGEIYLQSKINDGTLVTIKFPYEIASSKAKAASKVY